MYEQEVKKVSYLGSLYSQFSVSGFVGMSRGPILT